MDERIRLREVTRPRAAWYRPELTSDQSSIISLTVIQIKDEKTFPRPGFIHDLLSTQYLRLQDERTVMGFAVIASSTFRKFLGSA